MSARTAILDEIVLRLEEIDGTPDYNYTITRASWKDFRLPDSMPHPPEAYVLIDVTRMQGGQIGTHTQTDMLPVLIWGYVKAGQKVQEVAEKFMEDMVKALTLLRADQSTDLTLNNLAANMLIRSMDIVGDLTSERRTIEIGLEIAIHRGVGAL